MPDPDKPDFGLRMLGLQPTGGSQRRAVHGIGAGIYIDRHNLAVISRLDLRANLPLIEFVTPPGCLLR
jgi:hypothetical protein